MSLLVISTLICFLLANIGLALIFRKAGKSMILAFVPVYNAIVWIKIVKKPLWWLIFTLMPYVNIFMIMLLIVETLKAFNKHGLGAQILAIMFPFVYLPYLGFNKKLVYIHPDEQEKVKKSVVREWVEALVFAVVAASVIRIFFVEAYTIPTSSMEKSMLVGDFLFVDKVTFGSRVPMTPVAFPFVHHTLPLTKNSKSYIDWIRLPYSRYPHIRKIRNNDVVVFNFPAGDTVLVDNQATTYYVEVIRYAVNLAEQAGYGKEDYPKFMEQARNIILQNMAITVRPVDKRENYIKRCVAIPGDVIEIKNGQLFLNNAPAVNPKDMQYNYKITFKQGSVVSRKNLNKLGISLDDIKSSAPYVQYKGLPSNVMVLPMTKKIHDDFVAKYSNMLDTVPEVMIDTTWDPSVFPHNKAYPWNVDNFGPLKVPAKGQTVDIDTNSISLYYRIIGIYENNDVAVKDGKVFINGEEANKYTFKMDYYFMMGDNRHNSADCRVWGFVPEDHIVGKAAFVWLSLDKDFSLFNGKIRWNKLFRTIK